MSNRFWDLYEEELVKSVTKTPDEYALLETDTAESYARNVRLRMQENGLGAANHNTNTFRRLAKRLGIKFNRAALIEASKAPD